MPLRLKRRQRSTYWPGALHPGLGETTWVARLYYCEQIWDGGMNERERQKWFMSCGEMQILRGDGGEKWADVGDLFAVRGHGDVQAWAAAKGLGSTCALLQPWSVLMSVAPVS